MKDETIIYSQKDIPKVASRLKELLVTCPVLTFTGPLGAGKTTLVKELLAQLGVADLITSPTFAYVNEYANDEGTNFFHFDLYRIGTLEEFISAGFNEYLFAPHSRCLIEWPAPILPLIKGNACHISIDYDIDPLRRILHIKQDTNGRS